VELGESGRVVMKMAAQVEERKLTNHRGRKPAYCADVGRGLAREQQK
jgi:hypothetical protein